LKNDKKRKALSKKCLEKAKQYSWNSKMELMNKIINEVNESNY